MILDFLKKNLLSAGRQGDASLTAAFWTEDLGKDLSLHKAVDVAEGQVAASFADRPEAEASVREMLGLAYLNLKDDASAVKQYERAWPCEKPIRASTSLTPHHAATSSLSRTDSPAASPKRAGCSTATTIPPPTPRHCSFGVHAASRA